MQDEEKLLTEEQLQYVEKILYNTKRLSKLVGNMLRLSKVDNQMIQAKQASFRVDEQIRQSIVLKEFEWTKKNIDFDVDIETVEYTGNENLMLHVWHNLLGNAIKFSPQNGLIEIRLIRRGSRIIYTYVKCVQRVPGLTGSIYRLGNLYRHLHGKSSVYWVNKKMADHMQEYLEQHSYDVIRMTHIFQGGNEPREGAGVAGIQSPKALYSRGRKKYRGGENC